MDGTRSAVAGEAITAEATTVGAAPGRAQRRSSERWALAGLSLSMLLAALGTSIANVGLPTLVRTFDASFHEVQWVVLAYLLGITSLIVGVGRIGDVIGRRRLLLAGLGLFAAASAACGAAPTLWLLIGARAVQGLGAAIIMALALAMVRETAPAGRTGSAMGLLGTMSAVGTALGPTLGGILIAAAGWRAIFFATVPVGVLAWLLVWRFLPADRPRVAKPAGFDAGGTVLLAATLTAYALAMTVGRGGFGLPSLGLLLAAGCAAGLFALVEARGAAPLIRLAMLRDPVLGAGLAGSALVSTVVMTTLVVGPFYLAGALRLDAVGVGLVMSAGPVVAALAGVPAGRLVDRAGAPRVAFGGMAAMTAGCLALVLLPGWTGVPGYAVPLAVLTAGYALFQAANNTAVMTRASPEQQGVVSGVLTLSRNLGLITGASAMGAVFGMATGAPDLAAASVGAVGTGMRVTFAVAATLVVLALAIAASGRARAVPAGGASGTA